MLSEIGNKSSLALSKNGTSKDASAIRHSVQSKGNELVNLRKEQSLLATAA